MLFARDVLYNVWNPLDDALELNRGYEQCQNTFLIEKIALREVEKNVNEYWGAQR
jgi:hypothetical protein